MNVNDDTPLRYTRGRQAGAIVLLASVFVFLLSYMALSAVDLAAVETRLADALRTRSSARILIDGATQVIVARELPRLQEMLAQDAMPDCGKGAFCPVDGVARARALAIDDGGPLGVSYRSRVRGSAGGESAERRSQAAVSSHTRYRSGRFELDLSVQRRVDSAVLARTAVGLRVSVARETDQ